MKRLYVSLSFHYLVSSPTKTKGSNGFFNQIQSLLNAVQIAKRLNRQLVVDGFFPDFERNETIPLFKIFDESSFGTETRIQDGWRGQKPKHSRFLRDFCNPSTQSWVGRLERFETRETDLFVGCCFYYCLDSKRFQQNLESLGFHSVFYKIIGSFLSVHPSFFAIHYRTEEDFLHHFYQKLGFSSPSSMKSFSESLLEKQILSWKGQPVLFMTSSIIQKSFPVHLLRFQMADRDEKELKEYLGIDWERIREIMALFDFLLCESSACKEFVGVHQSSFSRGLVLRRKERPNHLLDLNNKAY